MFNGVCCMLIVLGNFYCLAFYPPYKIISLICSWILCLSVHLLFCLFSPSFSLSVLPSVFFESVNLSVNFSHWNCWLQLFLRKSDILTNNFPSVSGVDILEGKVLLGWLCRIAPRLENIEDILIYFTLV